MTRNVVNVEEIESFVQELESRTDFPTVREWLRSTYRRWLIKYAPNAAQVVPWAALTASREFALRDPANGRVSAYLGPTPNWLRPALQRGEAVWYVHCDPISQRDAWQAIDWLNALDGSPQFARIDRIGYPSALAMGRARLAQISETAAISRDWETLHQFSDGYRVVRLTTPRALREEGRRMGHCVAAYADDLANSSVEIMSLRDPGGKPHCTLEKRGWRIIQIQGKQNRSPIAKYRPYLRQFLIELGPTIGSGCETVGILRVAGQRVSDINTYVRMWEAAGAPAAWEIFSANPVMRRINLAPLRTIARFQDELTEKTRSRLFDMLRSGFGEAIKIRIVVSLDVFGTRFDVAHVDYPYGLFYLMKRGVFRNSERRKEIEHIIAAGMGKLLDELDANPNRIFVTKLRDVCGFEWYDDIGLIEAGNFEIRHLRHRRQTDLKKRLAAVRRENRNLLNDPGVSANCRIRWFDDWRKTQDLLETYAHDIL